MLKNGIIYFTKRMSGSLIVLLAAAIYTRLLPPAEYGVYALVMSGALMAYAGVMQWLALSLSRFLPAYREREAVLLAHVAFGFMAVVIVVAAAVLVPWLAPDGRWRQVLALGAVLFVVMSFAELNLMVFQMRLEPQSYVQYALVRVAVAAAIGVTLAWQGLGTTGLLLGLVAGNLCVVLPNLRPATRALHLTASLLHAGRASLDPGRPQRMPLQQRAG